MNIRAALVICCVFVLFYTDAQANEVNNQIIKMQGQVYIVDAENNTRTPANGKSELNENDTVVTGEGGRVVILLGNGDLSVLNEKSRLRIEKTGLLSQLSGKVYYVFKKIFTRQPRKIETTFATIGIRGTTFIVNVDVENKSIALKEGELNIESPDEVYAIRKKPDDEGFEEFKRNAQQQMNQMRQEYEDYRQQVAREFIEYRKSFELKANHVVHFDNRDVNKEVLSRELLEEFNEFDNFSGNHAPAAYSNEKLD